MFQIRRLRMPSGGTKGNQSKTGQHDSPETIAKKRAYWTPERREERRRQALAKNPKARYHGLSTKQARRLVVAVGACQRCGGKKRLSVHHRDRDKHNQTPANLEILCHRCHMNEHARTKETGWDSYHRNRKAAAHA